MNNRMLVVALLGLLFSPGPGYAQSSTNAMSTSNGTSGFALSDMKDIVRVGEIAMSPSGELIAAVVTRPNWEKNAQTNDLVIINTRDKTQRLLLHSAESVRDLQWDKAGATLSFLWSENKRGRVYEVDARGGSPQPVTDGKMNVSRYAWSHDGAHIALAAQAQEPAGESKAVKSSAYEVTDGHYLLTKPILPWQLYVMDRASHKVQELTDGREFSVGVNGSGVPPLAWTPDNRNIVFTSFPTPYMTTAHRTTIRSIAATGAGAATIIAPGEGSRGADLAASGDLFAYSRSRNGDQNNGNAVYVKKLTDAGDGQDITAGLARNISSFAWLPGNAAMLAAGPNGTRNSMWHVSIKGVASELKLGDVNPQGRLDVSASGKVAFVGGTAADPSEVYVLKNATSAPEKLTSYNQFLATRRLGKTSTVQWQSKDGFHADGVLVYPADYQQGMTYPVVLVIHGGPGSTSTTTFAPLPQAFAAQGYFVFSPNYRGGTGLGDAYQHAIYQDTGRGPGEDVMTGLEEVYKIPGVDRNRVSVSGWSYGGYMTGWLTSHYDMWKAAVAGAPLMDWVMDYSIAYYNRRDMYFFGGPPFERKYWEMWREQSPISHVDKVKTPTLILSDVFDPNVPIVNAYEWYNGLRDNGVPVKMVVYPDHTHFPTGIVDVVDVYTRWMGWIMQHDGTGAGK